MRLGSFAVLGLVGLLTMIVLGAIEYFDRPQEPDMAQVAALAKRPMVMAPQVATKERVDGVGFPDWSTWGWRAVGGRTDRFPDRATAAVLYERTASTARDARPGDADAAADRSDAAADRSDAAADRSDAAADRSGDVDEPLSAADRAEQRIAVVIVSGTRDVNSLQPTIAVQRTPPSGKVELTLGGTALALDGAVAGPAEAPGYLCGNPEACGLSPAHVSVKRKVAGHTVALVGWPVTAQLARQLQDLAVRGFPAP